MLRSDLCDYSHTYIVVKGTIDVFAAATNENDKPEKNVAFKNNALFWSCISKMNSTLMDNAEDFDIFIPMYNLLKYSQNYSMKSGSSWNYYSRKSDDINDNASDGKSFNYKANIAWKTPARPGNEEDANWQVVLILNVEVTIPFKYLSNFWGFLGLPLINCEKELDLSLGKDCVLIEHENDITGIDFMITSTKLYVQVVTLSVNDNIKFLENMKQRFKEQILGTNIDLK